MPDVFERAYNADCGRVIGLFRRGLLTPDQFIEELNGVRDAPTRRREAVEAKEILDALGFGVYSSDPGSQDALNEAVALFGRG